MPHKQSSTSKKPSAQKVPARTKAKSPEGTQPQKDADTIVLPTRKRRSVARKLTYTGLALVVIFVLTTASLRLAYSGRIYPGVWGHGVYLGGLTPALATSALTKQTATFGQNPVLIESPNQAKTTSIPLNDLAVNYDNAGLSSELILLGRQGSLVQQIITQWSLLVGVETKQHAKLTYNTDALAANAVAINNTLATPAVNARYEARDGVVGFVSGQSGTRLDFGNLGIALYDHLASLGDEAIVVRTVSVEPAVDNATLDSNKDLAQSYIAKPLSLTYTDKSWVVDPTTTLGWLHSTRSPTAQVYARNLLTQAYPTMPSSSDLDFDKGAIDSYLTTVAKDVDTAAVDAQLSVTDGRASIFVPSQDGKKLEVIKTRDAILASLKSSTADRTVTLNVTTLKPTVTQESLSSLGINELISEGVSYFPGSPTNRLINVRTGAARFNGVLLKPGQVFSFGELLGPVGPEQGYAKSLIILENKEVQDYGGGLCQVSSTAFRAALLAGLPILQRTNHAFAISYYTAPYGVPGVDATIYYPPVDFKFRNDTDAHILIQTEMVGTTLKFRFYGTKKKEGVIRGPYFVTGSSDVNQPSQTVFYRDVMVDGKLVKTDTFNTYYKSALDFPIQD